MRADQKTLLKESKQSFSWKKTNSNLKEMKEELLKYQVRLMIAKKPNSVLFWDSLSTRLGLTFLKFHQNRVELETKHRKYFTNWLILYHNLNIWKRLETSKRCNGPLKAKREKKSAKKIFHFFFMHASSPWPCCQCSEWGFGVVGTRGLS